MLKDALTQFSELQNLAQVVGTYLSNVIDMSPPGVDALGNTVRHDAGQSHLIVDARVVQAFASAGAGTMQVALVNDTNPNLVTAPVIVDETQVIALATLVAGYRFRLAWMPPPVTLRWLGLKYIIGGATMTAGTITAYGQGTVVA